MCIYIILYILDDTYIHNSSRNLWDIKMLTAKDVRRRLWRCMLQLVFRHVHQKTSCGYLSSHRVIEVPSRYQTIETTWIRPQLDVHFLSIIWIFMDISWSIRNAWFDPPWSTMIHRPQESHHSSVGGWHPQFARKVQARPHHFPHNYGKSP